MISGYQENIVNTLSSEIKELKGVQNVFKGMVEFDSCLNKKNELNIFIYCGNESFNEPYESDILTTDIEVKVLLLWTGDVNTDTSEKLFEKEIEIDTLIKSYLISFNETKISGCQKCSLIKKEPFINDSKKQIQIFYSMNFNLILI